MYNKFYFDIVTKTIKSVANPKQSIEITSKGASSNAGVTNTTSRWWEMFSYTGTHIKNINNGKSLDLNNIDTHNTNCMFINYDQKKKSQQWELIYVDEITKEYKTGEFNKEYGFVVNKDFYIISQLPTRRFLTSLTTSNVSIKTRFDQNSSSQKWYFEQNSRTIKSRRFNQALTFERNGAGIKAQLSAA